ncbi:PI-stichotoxin-She2a-like [Haemaphysalis longicornis]
MKTTFVLCFMSCLVLGLAQMQGQNQEAYRAVDFDIGCRPAPITGLCKAYFERWYFDIETGRCEQFVYGGCGGNANRYKTLRECEIACLRV